MDDICFIQSPICNVCGVPADISYDYPEEEFSCGVCRQSPYEFDRARSLGHYDTVLRQLIHYFKYQKQLGVLPDIERLLIKYFSDSEEEYSGFTVAPIPLHFNKMRERGFDQAFLLARQVAGVLGAPLESALLRRMSATSAQATKTKSERAQNIKGAFEVNRPERSAGKNILLVDDVFTTGATANEAAKILKKAGADKVFIFTLGRVVVGKDLGN
ncbi:MAG: ComF family protein [Nitrospinae bacterium]|nr:ComF family protein [Nitrospinota bacterium]